MVLNIKQLGLRSIFPKFKKLYDLQTVVYHCKPSRTLNDALDVPHIFYLVLTSEFQSSKVPNVDM